ncbi:hypothetical protein CFSAN002367_12992 [Clostridium botulinum CFSAN002367]|nr:hypothetical protein CFSAN002367_12992 [Clostridium botulinum CFSAN002367]
MLSPLLITLELCTKILSLVIIVIYEKHKKMLLYIVIAFGNVEKSYYLYTIKIVSLYKIKYTE